MLNFKQFVNQQLKEQSDLEDGLSENILSGLFKLGTKLATKKATKQAPKAAKEVAPKAAEVVTPSVRDRAVDALQRSNFGKDTKPSGGYDVWAAGDKLKKKLPPKASKAAEPKSSIAGDMLTKYKTKGTPEVPKLKPSTQNVSPGQPLKPGKRMSSIPTPTGSIAGKGSMVGNVARGAGKFALGLTAFAPDEMASGELSPEAKQFRDIEKTQPSNVRVGKGHPGEKTIYTHANNVSLPKIDVSDDARAKRKLEMPRDNSLEGTIRRMQAQPQPKSPIFGPERSPERAAKLDAARQAMLDRDKEQKRINTTSGSELMVDPTTGVRKPIAVQSKLSNAEYDRTSAKMKRDWESTKAVNAARTRGLSKKQQDDIIKAQRESTPQVQAQPKFGDKSSWKADRERREAGDAELRATLKKYGITLKK